MAKNKLSDLNDYLFLQMERLNDEDLKGDALQSEIERSKALTGVAREIVANASLEFEARKFVADGFGGKRELPASMSDKPRLVSSQDG